MGNRPWQLSIRWMLMGVAVLAIALGLGRAFFLAMRGARDAALRSNCSGRFCQLTVALHNYHDVYGSFPPAVVVDSQGKPMHSWRVLLLPFLESADIYHTYDFNEPWDGPKNRRLANRMPASYRCPRDWQPGSSSTSYVAVVGAATAFPGVTCVKLDDIKDGPDTILLVEIADSDIHWMEPRDLDFEALSFQVNDPTRPAISSRHPGGANVGMKGSCGGTFLANSLSSDDVKALLTIGGGESVTIVRSDGTRDRE